ncbi:hypothetical protein [Kitasatospora sp. NPDC085464]|uniref:hypothetical protein n=1 Tax=Kitasatospora sp. NPDC085464 TaxID=3364063 RepID=UPI0037CB7F0E
MSDKEVVRGPLVNDPPPHQSGSFGLVESAVTGLVGLGGLAGLGAAAKGTADLIRTGIQERGQTNRTRIEAARDIQVAQIQAGVDHARVQAGQPNQG